MATHSANNSGIYVDTSQMAVVEYLAHLAGVRIIDWAGDPVNDSPPHLVYVLACRTPGHYYVGATQDLESRVETHLRGNGASFTRAHGVSRVIKRVPCAHRDVALALENILTRLLISLHGRDRVAGSGWSQIL